jgi:hypothetical protein
LQGRRLSFTELPVTRKCEGRPILHGKAALTNSGVTCSLGGNLGTHPVRKAVKPDPGRWYMC